MERKASGLHNIIPWIVYYLRRVPLRNILSMIIQWNLSLTDTLGTKKQFTIQSFHYSEVI